MIRTLEIVSDSWPIATMVVASVAGLVIWSSIRRAMKNDMTKEMHRLEGSNAVIVQQREQQT